MFIRCVALIIGLAGLAAPSHAAQLLYDDLGGEAGISRIVDGMMEIILADPRTASTFEESNTDRVARLIKEQFCELTGGPCVYSGQTMAKSHQGLKLTTAHFNALVEGLQTSMDNADVPFTTQNRLLALLAPMHRDVVTQ